MKPSTVFPFLPAALLALAGTAFANDEPAKSTLEPPSEFEQAEQKEQKSDPMTEADQSTLTVTEQKEADEEFRSMDTDKDDRISQAELAGNDALSGTWSSFDADKDGLLSRNEWNRYCEDMAAKKTAMDGDDDDNEDDED